MKKMASMIPFGGKCGIELSGRVVYGDPIHDRVTGRAEESVTAIINVDDPIRGNSEQFEVSEIIKANSGDVDSVARTAYPSYPAELLPKIVGGLITAEVDKSDELEKAKRDRIVNKARFQYKAGVYLGGTTAVLGTSAVYSFIEGQEVWGVGLSIATVMGAILAGTGTGIRENEVFSLGEDQEITKANNRVGLLKIMQISVKKRLVVDTANSV